VPGRLIREGIVNSFAYVGSQSDCCPLERVGGHIIGKMGNIGDMELLQEYAFRKSEDSFSTVVSRHINLVYSVALRQVGNTQHAEEITQAVFLTLARKARSLGKNTVFSGWLFHTTRLTAANFQRSELRRTRREMEAFMQSNLNEDTTDSWREIGPLLNDAIASLGAKERDAVVLRFVEGRNLKEVGATLGVSEEAAKKRVSRAVEKLRAFFGSRGARISSDVLSGVIEAKAMQLAPASLAGLVISQALNQATATPSALVLMKTTLKWLAWTKMKTALATATALLFASATIGIMTAASSSKEQKADAKAPPTKPATPHAAGTNVLIFRNKPSWNRKPDFEDVLAAEGFGFEVKPSSEMQATELAPYRFVIIPGAQQPDYYEDYTASAARFDRYVTSGGTLVLELNGAEESRITLPAGVTIAKHGALDNLIVLPNHPILTQYSGKQIHADFASHGFLEGLPADATILVTEMMDDHPALDRPTFAEYGYGKGRVLAACQCFHDRDRSRRGILMPGLLNYARERDWYKPTKQKEP
jgi:RNA polymerase sigma factor (sigma-70 family)